jgi:hypothetical protein
LLNRPFIPVISRWAIPFSDSRYPKDPEEAKSAQEIAERLDQVPAMSATVLGLEMLLHEPCLDLRLAAEVVLSDVGASIQVLRLIGREFEFVAERPRRMVECLASLDVKCWFAAISAQTYACDREHSKTATLWNHSRLVAQYAELVAHSFHSISPEDAYLVGLLHEVESFPTVLGWPDCGAGGRTTGFMVATEEALPPFVVAAMREVNDSDASSTWKFILTAAHGLAGIHTEDQGFLHEGKDSAECR